MGAVVGGRAARRRSFAPTCATWFNPTRTVPTGILSRDILPPLQRGDFDVLRRKKLDVLDALGWWHRRR
jgi:murein L,D-transpeptidase YcbB/YkuD